MDNIIKGSAAYKAVTDALIDQIFVGEYAERRYVEALKSYRDVIKVNKEESNFKKVLKDFHSFVKTAFSYKSWVGITEDENESDADLCLWTDIQEVPLGKYWFRIESIEFRNMEILLKLKCLRTFQEKFNNVHEVFDLSMDKVKEVLTFHNFCESIKFCAIAAMAFATFLVNALQYIADYTLQFIRMLAVLVEAGTPMTIAVLDFFARCIMGLLWFIYMLIKGNGSALGRGPPLALMQNPGRNNYYRARKYVKY